MKKGIIVVLVLLFIASTLNSITGLVYKKIINDIDKNFYLNGDKVIYIEYGNKYGEAGFNASINENKNYRKNVIVENNVNDLKVGEYEVNYTVKYLGYSKTLTRKVYIIDSVVPTLELDCKKDQYIPINGKYKECTYTTSDNYDRNLSDKVVIDSEVDNTKVGDYKVTYSVSDSSNNTISKSINVHVRKKFDITYIVVTISKQRLDYYQNNELVLTTPITSGRNNATRTGNFKVKKKARDTTLKGKDYTSFVKYWLGYDGSSFGIHDASWRRRFGTMDYKKNGSHGCINVPTNAMKNLYSMVELGTPVYIKK